MDIEAQTLRSYTNHARIFAEKFKRLTDVHRRYEFGYFMHILKGNKILDVGCGAGDHTLYFQLCNFDCQGIDFCPAMVALCHEQGVRAQVMNMESLMFDASTFDGIWAVTSLLHVPRARVPGVIAGFSHILKPGGIVYVCVKEGFGERLIPDTHDLTTQRFFSYWQEHELHETFNSTFDVIDSRLEEHLGTNYIHTFFKNRKSSEIP
ncbi:class I SAM-dependent methyltransferase [Candidatus Pacearchaeota archaeon]|nr:class I SAM-dependent methyltransferase [Candidatus Pacearchaeota archaeon]